MPQDFSPWLSRFKLSPKSSEHLIEAIDLATQLGFKPLADAFRQKRMFLEQEVLL